MSAHLRAVPQGGQNVVLQGQQVDVALAHALGVAGVDFQLGVGGGQVEALGHRLEDQQLVAAGQDVLLGVGQQGVGGVVAHEAGEELVQRLVAEHGRLSWLHTW